MASPFGLLVYLDLEYRDCQRLKEFVALRIGCNNIFVAIINIALLILIENMMIQKFKIRSSKDHPRIVRPTKT